MSKIKELAKIGQSVWYDYIRRSLLTSGELNLLIDEGLRGMTSNPTIFEKAIAGSSDYDAQLRRYVGLECTSKEIYEALAIDDIRNAAKLFLPLYEETEFKDGYVSLEVNPELANNTEETIGEAKRLFESVGYPNVMIKVPATSAGIPAIHELIASGVNINVTLIFSIENYKKVAEAYIHGLEDLGESGPVVSGGKKIGEIASVASFFVSRVDTAVDQELQKIGNKELQGTIAVANSKLAYHEFDQIFSGDRWERLSQKGARKQRLLWGSTGTKNPAYSDTLYVDELIGPETVNTMPPATYDNFKDHGKVHCTLAEEVDDAKSRIEKLAELGISLEKITEKLQLDGVDAFANSYFSLLKSIDEKIQGMKTDHLDFKTYLGKYQSIVDDAMSQLRENKIVPRIWKHDHMVWKDDPKEIINRLGWLNSPEQMLEAVTEIESFVNEIKNAGFTQTLLLGMGGSSLAPEVFRKVFGVKVGYLHLGVLDSTDPESVRFYSEKFAPGKTLYVVSTKSGGTVETMSFMKYFYNQVKEKLSTQNPGDHFIAITDPGSGLENTAKSLNFRKIFLNDPDIGGRYSALSYFGLVPAGLMGVDLLTLLERAATMACNCEGCNCPVSGINTGALLGATLGMLAKQGRDKLTLVSSSKISYFGAWVEQLIAESTGKEGMGIFPVDGEVLADADSYVNDRLFVYLHLQDDNGYDNAIQALQKAGHPVIQVDLIDLYDLGGEFFRWEFATAVASMFLRINPFDQPNVESAKVLAREMVASYKKEGSLPKNDATIQAGNIAIFTKDSVSDLSSDIRTFFSKLNMGENEGLNRSYVAIQAYLNPSKKADEILQKIRTGIQKKYRVATSLGYGPRFLHSTGQLHKGDAGFGLFIQITADSDLDIPIPDNAGKPNSSITFGVLELAQALGDRQALLNAGRNVIRFHLSEDPIEGLIKISKLLA
jgi:transaldolase/glucose-6-phosphate isomerase